MSTTSTDEQRRPGGWRAWVTGHAALGLSVTLLVIIADQLTKRLALTQLRPIGRVVDVPGPVDLTLTFNDGGAFGLPAPTWVFGIVTVVVVTMVVRILPHVAVRTLALAYGLLLGGALGNATDRLLAEPPAGVTGFFEGRVTDFLKLVRIGDYQFPIFNVADVAITVGFVLLVVGMYLDERRLEAEAEAEGADEDAPVAEEHVEHVEPARQPEA